MPSFTSCIMWPLLYNSVWPATPLHWAFPLRRSRLTGVLFPLVPINLPLVDDSLHSGHVQWHAFFPELYSCSSRKLVDTVWSVYINAREILSKDDCNELLPVKEAGGGREVGGFQLDLVSCNSPGGRKYQGEKYWTQVFCFPGEPPRFQRSESFWSVYSCSLNRAPHKMMVDIIERTVSCSLY